MDATTLLPETIPLDWLLADLGVSDRTLIKWRRDLIQYCPSYKISVVARYKSFTDYQAWAIKNYPRLPDTPPFSRQEAIILMAYAFLIISNGEGRGRYQRSLNQLIQNPEFWRKFDIDSYNLYQEYKYASKGHSQAASRPDVRGDRFPISGGESRYRIAGTLDTSAA